MTKHNHNNEWSNANTKGISGKLFDLNKNGGFGGRNPTIVREILDFLRKITQFSHNFAKFGGPDKNGEGVGDGVGWVNH